MVSSGNIEAVAADEELVRRVADSLAISPAEAARVVEEVVAFYLEPVESVVRRWHAAGKLRGRPNSELYPLIVRGLRGRVVQAPDLSERQVRRIIYG